MLRNRSPWLPLSIVHLLALVVVLAGCTAPAPAAPAASTPAVAPSAAVPTPVPPAGAVDIGGSSVERGGTVRVSISAEPLTLNPLLASQNVSILVGETVIEGLLVPMPDGTYAPLLAEEVPTRANGGVSADGLTVTWRLKKDVRWSDGAPFTSRDVVFTYDVIANPANPIPSRSAYADIDSVTATDDHTVVVKFKQVYAGYREQFLNVLPAHVFGGDTVIDKKDYNRNPVGTGPFKLQSWVAGSHLVFERNPNYREPGKPYLDSVIFQVMPSREAALQAYKVGETDVLSNLIEANIPEVSALPNTVLNPVPSDRVERLILNTSCPDGDHQGDPACPHPVLGDVRVRQAIELAIDKQALVDRLLYGKTTVATSVIPLGWHAASLPASEFNPDRARQLLDEAGWRPGPDGVRAKDGVRAQLEFGTTTGDRLREQTQQVIQEQLAAVGIATEIKNAPSAVILGSWKDGAPRARGNFDILMWTTNAGLEPQPQLFSYFHSSQVPSEANPAGRNYHRIQDPELDRALEVAGSTVDQAARKAAYQTVAERVNADKGHIVLYNRLDLDIFRSTVKGRQANTWDFLAWDIENWWVASR